jgi:hypothetical protein
VEVEGLDLEVQGGLVDHVGLEVEFSREGPAPGEEYGDVEDEG